MYAKFNAGDIYMLMRIEKKKRFNTLSVMQPVPLEEGNINEKFFVNPHNLTSPSTY